MKIIQNRTRKSESESESEEGEIDKESDFKMENPDTFERNGFEPISTSPVDEQKLHTDGKMPTGENENKYLETENLDLRRSNRKCMQSTRYGEYKIQKTFGCGK